jgi:hypothetical protein
MKGPRGLWPWGAALALLPLLGCLCGCSGTTQEAGTPSPYGGEGGWVDVRQLVGSAPILSTCNTVDLSGRAFISPTLWHCCSSAASDTGVGVTRENRTTQESGP